VSSLGEFDFDTVLAGVRQSFLEDTADRLDAIEGILDQYRRGAAKGPEPIANLRREAHTLKGAGTSFGFPAITVIAHRLENYLQDLTKLADRAIGDIQQHIDAAQEIVSTGQNPGEKEIALILRSLPQAQAFNPKRVELGSIEALIVTPSRLVGHLLTRQLARLGIRSVTTQSSLEGLALALRTRPDLVITSVTMAELGGIDLARAFAAMGATRSIPVAILTSFSDRDIAGQGGLPGSASVLHIGQGLERDLRQFLKQLTVKPPLPQPSSSA
jgi:CheY-like chemotaxis protein/HPt (histidine-containing phosphotransfer) domain-containing protein